MLVGNDKSVLVSLYCVEKRSHVIYFDKVYWSRCREELQLRLFAVLGVVSGAAWACISDVVEVCSHARPA